MVNEDKILAYDFLCFGVGWRANFEGLQTFMGSRPAELLVTIIPVICNYHTACEMNIERNSCIQNDGLNT